MKHEYLRERERLLLYRNGVVVVCVLYLFPTGLWVGLQSIILTFPCHARLRF